MFQSVIRDPGGDGLIRSVPDVCDQYAVVNGSILLVPADTTAYLVLNGSISRPYSPGRYEIFTGVDPFFVRLRNLMHRGDPGISVSVYYVSNRQGFLKFGTGELMIKDPTFNITLKAMALCAMTYRIANPLVLLKEIVGLYRSTFSEEEELTGYIEQLVLPPIRSALSRALGGVDPVDLNNDLGAVSTKAAPLIRQRLGEYGINVLRFDISAINIPDTKRLEELEDYKSKGRLLTDQERRHLNELYGGDILKRTLVETMTGTPDRGQVPMPGQPASQPPGGWGGGMNPYMQMLLMKEIMPELRNFVPDMTRHMDVIRPTVHPQQSQSRPAGSPNTRCCPGCNSQINIRNRVCPICGHRF